MEIKVLNAGFLSITTDGDLDAFINLYFLTIHFYSMNSIYTKCSVVPAGTMSLAVENKVTGVRHSVKSAQQKLFLLRTKI